MDWRNAPGGLLVALFGESSVLLVTSIHRIYVWQKLPARFHNSLLLFAYTP